MKRNIFVNTLLPIATCLLLFQQQHIGNAVSVRLLTTWKYKHLHTDSHIEEIEAIIEEYADRMTLAAPGELFRYTKADGQSDSMPMFEHAKNVMEVAIFYRKLLQEQYTNKANRVTRGVDEEEKGKEVPAIDGPELVGGPNVDANSGANSMAVNKVQSFNKPHPLNSHGKISTQDKALKKIKEFRYETLDKAVKGRVTLEDLEHWNSSHAVVNDLLRDKIRPQKYKIKRKAMEKFVEKALNAMKNYAKASQYGLLTPEQEQQYIPVLKQFKNGV